MNRLFYRWRINKLISRLFYISPSLSTYIPHSWLHSELPGRSRLQDHQPRLPTLKFWCLALVLYSLLLHIWCRERTGMLITQNFLVMLYQLWVIGCLWRDLSLISSSSLCLSLWVSVFLSVHQTFLFISWSFVQPFKTGYFLRFLGNLSWLWLSCWLISHILCLAVFVSFLFQSLNCSWKNGHSLEWKHQFRSVRCL